MVNNKTKQKVLADSLSHEERLLNYLITKLIQIADSPQEKFLAKQAETIKKDIFFRNAYKISFPDFLFKQINTNVSIYFNLKDLLKTDKSFDLENYESFTLLNKFYETGNEKYYHEAIEHGLLEDIDTVATEMSFYEEYLDPKICSDFVLLVRRALNPITKFHNNALYNSDKQISEKSKYNLSIIGAKLAKVRPHGRPRKLPLENTPFNHYFKQMITVLYQLVRKAFKEARIYNSLLESKNYLKSKLDSELYSNLDLEKLFRLEPNKAAKELLCTFFDLRKRSLDKLLSKNK